MARSRSIHAYDAAYYEIVEEIGMNMRSRTEETRNAALARSLQGKFYAFVGAVKIAARELMPDDQSDLAKKIRLIAPFAHKVQVWQHSDLKVDPEGKVGEKRFLTFRHRSESEDSQFFARAARGARMDLPGEMPAGPLAAGEDAAAAASLAKFQAMMKPADGEAGIDAKIKGYLGRPARDGKL